MSDLETNVTALGTAIVTGASAGIGKAYATRLAARGYNLILVARRSDRLTSLAKELQSTHGVSVRTIIADLSVPQGLERVSSEAANENITLLVNNAGTATLAPLEQISDSNEKAMVDLNVLALTHLSKIFLPEFRKRDHGTIINISSTLAFHAIANSAIYSATKAYVMVFTRGLQDEVAGTGVKVQLVLPAATATDLWDLSGVPLHKLDQATVMTVDNLVDASLRGLDLGELVTLPSVENTELLSSYDRSRMSLLGAGQTSSPASRYAKTT